MLRSDKWLIAISILPALIVGVIFEICVGHRHDYSGHFVAGYGATFATAMLLLRVSAGSMFEAKVNRFVVPFCMACIAGGGFAEATAFNIAKFDEIDFCNQSIGAVVATLCASAYLGRQFESKIYDYGLVVGICFLGVGGCLAVA